ncbi:MAG: epoxide hydrolase family protein [Sphingobium sp.]
MTIGTPRPFEICWDTGRIAALKADVTRVVLPPAPAGCGWSLGCDRDFLERFRAYWLDGYDFAAAQAELNAHRQYLVEIDGLDIHYVMIRSEAATPRPLLITHGWPGSHHEFWSAADRLAFPSRYGGSPLDAFDIVLPSLPGYGYSAKPARPIGPKTVAGMWHRLMTEVLGYPYYLAQGGDWGSIVTSIMGLDAPQGLRAIHLNMSGLRSEAAAQTAEEAEWMTRNAAALAEKGAYARLNATKPMSLAWLAAGNPLGQAAWILERFHDWSDLRDTNLEAVYGLDHLCTNVMLYVMTDSFATAAWMYNGRVSEGGNYLAPDQKCMVPTGFARFPMDGVQPPPPRSWIERLYNVVHFSEPARGGHFAAMEVPDAFAADVVAWGRSVWPVSG